MKKKLGVYCPKCGCALDMQNCFYGDRVNVEQPPGTKNFLCPECETWVTLDPNGSVSYYDGYTDELCPYCGRETGLPVTGGYCTHCGHSVLPCSMCDCCRLPDAKGCPFEAIRPR